MFLSIRVVGADNGRIERRETRCRDSRFRLVRSSAFRFNCVTLSLSLSVCVCDVWCEIKNSWRGMDLFGGREEIWLISLIFRREEKRRKYRRMILRRVMTLIKRLIA